MKCISLNPVYVLKPDNGRALLILKEMIRYNDLVKNGTEFILHPIHAAILNCINGDDYNVVIDKIVSLFHIDRKLVENFIDQLIDNNNYVEFRGKELPPSYRLPPQVIISSDFKRKNVLATNEFLNGESDIRPKRHATPTNIVLMVNNKCVTDCFYCYADKRNPIDCQLSLERIQQLIEEAKKIHVNTFNVIGGEFFLYEHWKELLGILYANGYDTYLSTKIPLSEKVIKELSQLKIKDLQISLDTLRLDNLCSILNVNMGYIEKMKKAFQLLEKYNICITIHTILNSKNDSIEDVQSLFEFLTKYHNIHEWRLDIAAPSLYKTDSYDLIRPNPNKLENIMTLLDELKEKTPFRIIYPRHRTYKYTINERADAFKHRNTCSANYSGFFILPDGNVTICEELYWYKRFIIGNVMNQSLLEVWNSKKALNLFYLSQDEILQDSKCSSCAIYTQCRHGKGVCWKSVIKEYGEDKWYYPDPLCPQ